MFFLLYISDLFAATSNNVHSYADDMTFHDSQTFFSYALFTSNLDTMYCNFTDSINENFERILHCSNASLISFNYNKKNNSEKHHCTTPPQSPHSYTKCWAPIITKDFFLQKYILLLARIASLKLVHQGQKIF